MSCRSPSRRLRPTIIKKSPKSLCTSAVATSAHYPGGETCELSLPANAAATARTPLPVFRITIFPRDFDRTRRDVFHGRARDPSTRMQNHVAAVT